MVLAHTPLSGPIGLSMARRRMPNLVFSPDLLESLQRSVADYRPLAVPDAAILLDLEPTEIAMLRPVVAPPFEIPPGDTVVLVFAPVTAARAWVRWRLVCEIASADRTNTVHWDLAITAETGMAQYHPDGSAPDWTPVYELYRDHWDPDNDVRSREAGWEGSRPLDIAAHMSADGTGILTGPPRQGPEPETAEAAALRESGDAHIASGRLDAAVDDYRRAIDAGSGAAAYALGTMLQRQGNLTEARRWLLEAARKRIFPAFNDIGSVAFVLGDADQAEAWFRRAMDEGDWTAAVNLATLDVTRGRLAEAEEILQVAQIIHAPGAAKTLTRVLVDQGRLDEAEEMLVRDATEPPGDHLFPGEPMHDRLFRLAEFLMNQRGDVSRGLDAIRTAIDSESTPPKAIAIAATALDRLAVDLANGAEPRVADAVRAATVRVSAHRRLFALDPTGGRWPYDRAVEDLITVSSACGDWETSRAAMTELAALRRNLRADS